MHRIDGVGPSRLVVIGIVYATGAALVLGALINALRAFVQGDVVTVGEALSGGLLAAAVAFASGRWLGAGKSSADSDGPPAPSDRRPNS